MNKAFVKLALAACITAIAYGLFNMFRPTVIFGTFPNFPFPFLPPEVTWFDHVYTVDYFCDPISCVYRDPHWLVWSLALYAGIFGLLVFSLKSKLVFPLSRKYS